MKKFLSIVLCLAMMLCILPTAAPKAKAAVEGDYLYTVTDGKATITSYNKSSTATDITIPSTLGGYPVVEIGNDSFENSTNLISVTISEGITRISYNAFYYCSNLESIAIPSTINVVCGRAFDGCWKLKKVYISDIAAWCSTTFSEVDNTGAETAHPLCSGASMYLNGELLTDLIIPSNVKHIKKDAFRKCSSIKSVTIPDSVELLEYGAFSNCPKLNAINMSDNVMTEGNPFYNTAYYKDQNNWENNMFYVGQHLLDSIGPWGDCVIKKGTKNIASFALSYCEGMTSITIPNSVERIGYEAFYGCSNLQDIYYSGTEKQKETMAIEAQGNELWDNATWHYNSCISKAEHDYTDADDKNCNTCGYGTYSVVFKDTYGKIIGDVTVNSDSIINGSKIPDAPIKYGYNFIGWSYDFTQPIMSDIVVTPLYEKNTASTYEISVSDGTIVESPNGSNKTYYNDRVKLQAAAEKDGKAFSYWKANGGIFSYSNEISFLAFGDAEFEAVYGAEVENQYVVFTDSNPTVSDYNTGKYDMHVMGVVSAAGKEVSEIGVLLAAGEYTAEEMIDGTARTIKLVSTKATNGRQFVYTIKNIAYDNARTAIVYAVIDGVTYYSDASCTALVESKPGAEFGGDEIIDAETPDPFA